MTARIFTPENRLANVLDSLDAPTAAELAAEAEAQTAQMADAIRAYVAEKTREILRFSGQGEDVLFAECRVLADASLNVAEVAGAAGMEAVGEVARGIAAMIHSLLTNGVWRFDALKLHLDALALVSHGGGKMSEENKVILARLHKMREAVGVAE